MDNNINCLEFSIDINEKAGKCCWIEEGESLPSEICVNCIHCKFTLEDKQMKSLFNPFLGG